MSNQLIFDVGMHKCEDAEFYLKRGFKVISIDADLNLVNEARERFKDFIDADKFKVLHFAIADKDDEDVTFNISEKTLWNSLNPNISNRKGKLNNSVTVKTKKLSTLIEKYGIPHYCKIDIEGYDNICLNTLTELQELPRYISVESECIGEGETITDEEALETLKTLHKLGYTKFKLVEQYTLSVLKPDEKFFSDGEPFFKRIFNKVLNSPKKPLDSNRDVINQRFNHDFPQGASGPFGEDIEGEWISYEIAVKTLKKHRHDYFKLSKAFSYGFWCDWHATK